MLGTRGYFLGTSSAPPIRSEICFLHGTYKEVQLEQIRVTNSVVNHGFPFAIMKTTTLDSRPAAPGNRTVSEAFAVCLLTLSILWDVEAASFDGSKAIFGLENDAPSHLISALPGFEGAFPSRQFAGGSVSFLLYEGSVSFPLQDGSVSFTLQV